MAKIKDDLAELTLPVYKQGTAPETLPESFFTFWEDYSDDNLNGDNAVLEVIHEYTLVYYTKDFSTIYTGLQAAINTLKGKGYIIGGTGYDFGGAYDGWECRAVDIKFIEYLED